MMNLAKGYVALLLHAHLPFVRHPDYDNFIEERWLFEAISETYIPLMEVFDRLDSESIDYRLTMSITPTLLTMLSDKLLMEKYEAYLAKLISLTEKEIARTEKLPEFNQLAIMYHEKYNNDLRLFTGKYGRNLAGAFKRHQDNQKLEIIACTATHGFLPLLNQPGQSLNAQVEIGVESYISFFGRKPNGIWLPECGYIPEVEKALSACEIKYFITETHGLLFADPRPVYGTYAPIVTPSGIIAFGRDMESSRQVWSTREGYPGDFDYREYYRDIGYDLDLDYIGDYIYADGHRTNTGIKYYRITGKSEAKQPYNPQNAAAKADIHAADFLVSRQKQVEMLEKVMGKPPVVVCPYDAELFGHWWYEGPQWIYHLLKKASYNNILSLITLSEYINQNPVMQISSPCSSSWGNKGYNEVWLNSTNDWIYRHLHKAAERMGELADEYYNAEGVMKNALNQAARELLLAQSSDWAFIMKTGTTVDYAEKRINDHISRFTRLYHDIREDCLDIDWLKQLEDTDNIFPDVDFRIYANGKSTLLHEQPNSTKNSELC